MLVTFCLRSETLLRSEVTSSYTVRLRCIRIRFALLLGDCGQGGNGFIQALLHLLHRLIAALQVLPQVLNL